MHLGVILLSVALISAGQTLAQITATEETPPETTEVPATITEEPSETTTEEPLETTAEPVETTEEPPETTEEPSGTTQEPPETTDEPAATTEEPSETTEEPEETTNEEPLETTEEPSGTTQEPPETTDEPAATTEEPSETTEEPPETTEIPATTELPPETTEEPATTTAVPSTTTVGPSIECSYIKNGIVMHRFDCHKYIVCHDAVATVLSCPVGQIFSWQTLSCGTSNICSEYSTGFETLESVACRRQAAPYAEHPYLPYQYVDCARLATRSCASNTIFRWTYQRCLPGSQATNQLQPVRGWCGFWGEQPHPYLCEQYFQCRFWVLTKKTCPSGLIYDASRKRCRYGNFQTCQLA